MSVNLSKTQHQPRHALDPEVIDRGLALDYPPVTLNIDRLDGGGRLPFWTSNGTTPPLVALPSIDEVNERDLIPCTRCGCAWSCHHGDHCHGVYVVQETEVELMPGFIVGVTGVVQCDCDGMQV